MNALDTAIIKMSRGHSSRCAFIKANALCNCGFQEAHLFVQQEGMRITELEAEKARLSKEVSLSVDEIAGLRSEITRRDEIIATTEKLWKDAQEENAKLRAALRGLLSRFTGVFNAYVRPSYANSGSNGADSDYELAIWDAKAALEGK